MGQFWIDPLPEEGRGGKHKEACAQELPFQSRQTRLGALFNPPDRLPDARFFPQKEPIQSNSG
jgi:hypothetical protein